MFLTNENLTLIFAVLIKSFIIWIILILIILVIFKYDYFTCFKNLITF